jgi:hypothetical protein
MTTTNDPQQQPALGTCARCDQPATVAITDAPGNVRCDSACGRDLPAAAVQRAAAAPTVRQAEQPAHDLRLWRVCW